MKYVGHIIRFFAVALCVCLAPVAAAQDSPVKVTGRYASIVVDANTLDIVHARQIDVARYPASLTKVMTLYLTFDAIEAGEITLQTPMHVSRYAAKTPPSALGLRAGTTITVEDAIKALAVKSANDVAIVLAEHIGGSEDGFAAMMTAKARALGMASTTFHNPHGLPHIGQTTTARDMAKLASAVLQNHGQYYRYFGLKTFTYKGRLYKNTNRLLPWLSGVDGFKTGYTRASGYNLIISAKRDGRRVIAVVLGGASGTSRDRHMQDLIERSFDTLGVSPVISTPPHSQPSPRIAKVVREPVPRRKTAQATKTTALRLRGRNSEPVTIITSGEPIALPDPSLASAWAVQIGAFRNADAAKAQIGAARLLLKADVPSAVLPMRSGDARIYRARLTGLTLEQAQKRCRALAGLKTGCVVIAPSG